MHRKTAKDFLNVLKYTINQHTQKREYTEYCMCATTEKNKEEPRCLTLSFRFCERKKKIRTALFLMKSSPTICTIPKLLQKFSPATLFRVIVEWLQYNSLLPYKLTAANILRIHKNKVVLQGTVTPFKCFFAPSI